MQGRGVSFELSKIVGDKLFFFWGVEGGGGERKEEEKERKRDQSNLQEKAGISLHSSFPHSNSNTKE